MLITSGVLLCPPKSDGRSGFSHQECTPLSFSPSLIHTLCRRTHELRVRFQRVNYRILYFFHDQKAVLSHGLVKEQDVPPGDIDLAIRRRTKYQNDPKKHTYSE
jgi:hypothetical protein